MSDKSKLIICILCMLCILPLASATISNLGTFKQGDCMQLIQTCDTCTYNNITTVMYPNSNITYLNAEMERDDTSYNYTFCPDISGNYKVNGFGNLDGIKTIWAYTFQATPTGKSLTTSSSITQGIILLLMFGAVVFFLIFAKLTDVPGVKLFFNLIGYIVMLLSIGTGYILMQNSDVQSNLSFTVNALLFIFGIVFVIIMFYILINQTRHTLQLMKIKKGFGSEYDNNIF